MKRKIAIAVAAAAVCAGVACVVWWRKPGALVLTGVVTTDEVIVGPEIQGRLQALLVKPGDTVTNGQLVAVIHPAEWDAEMKFYANSEAQSVEQVAQAGADLKFQEAQLTNQIAQAEADLAAARANVVQAESDLENATLTFKREDDLYRKGADSIQAYDQARTGRDAAQARVDSLRRQAQAAEAAVGMARANADQVVSRRASLLAAQHQRDAMDAQKEKAKVRLNYTEIHAPTNGIVDVRAALEGEVVTPGQAIVTLINPDELWVRADVEETYVDRIYLGEKLMVQLPSGARREGTVFYRGVDGDYATQRDVSRTKRDIKTFEVRVRCDNRDRSLAVGMTAYVEMPLK